MVVNLRMWTLVEEVVPHVIGHVNHHVLTLVLAVKAIAKEIV